MLSERINILFKMLGCNNTDIARFAHCSSGNISKLRTGNREPPAASRTIVSFTNAVYGYADYENLVPVLQELCGADDSSRESLVPALTAWLYGTGEVVLPSYVDVPKTKRTRALQRQQFGSKLDRALTLLDLSNSKVADLLNVDASLISRYRSGIFSPLRNAMLAKKLSDMLISRAEMTGRSEKLAGLCGTDAAHLDTETVSVWLYDISSEDSADKAFALLDSLDDLLPSGGSVRSVQELPEAQIADYYYGADGLRNATVRILTDAAREGGELYFYSDEPADWLLGDKAFFEFWTSLMAGCVDRGVMIRIIHNVDRDDKKVISAINRWIPFYSSGMLVPYVFRQKRDERFCHTLFLRPGRACVRGFFPAFSQSRWYEYITDPARLDIMKDEFDSMLLNAFPIMNVYSASNGDDYRAFVLKKQESRTFLLTGFPVFTAPEELLEKIVSRACPGEPLRNKLLGIYAEMRTQFRSMLQRGPVNIILNAHGRPSPAGTSADPAVNTLPQDSQGEPTPADARVNFALELIDVPVRYTPAEYAEHVDAIIDLVKNEKNFHLTLLSDPPVRNTQIALLDDSASIIYSKGTTYNALVFFNQEIKDSVSFYLSSIIDLRSSDRQKLVEELEIMRRSNA